MSVRGPGCVKTIVGRSTRSIRPFIEILQSIKSMAWKIAPLGNWTNLPRHLGSPGFTHSLSHKQTLETSLTRYQTVLLQIDFSDT